MQPTNYIEKTLDEFDTLDFSKWETEGDTVKFTMLCNDKIKSFIKSALEGQREEIREAIKNMSDVEVQTIRGNLDVVLDLKAKFTKDLLSLLDSI